MLPFLTKYYGNPSSGYGFAAMARKAINLARERLAALLGCEPTEIVFTSGGTESNNAVINSALQFETRGKSDTGLIRVDNIWSRPRSNTARCFEPLPGSRKTRMRRHISRRGWQWQSRLGELEAAIRPETALVSIMWANNETGVIFPIEKIAEICRQKRRACFIQTPYKQPAKSRCALRDSAINFLSLSAHKFHGPKGVGALYVDRQTRFSPLIAGGSQENGRRGGTENVASIVGLGKAAELALKYLTEGKCNIRSMRDRFEKSVLEAVSGACSQRGGRRPDSQTRPVFHLKASNLPRRFCCWIDKVSVAPPARPAGPVHRKLRTCCGR